MECAEIIQAVGKKKIAAVGLTIHRGKDECRAYGNRGAESACSSAHSVLRDANGSHARSQRQKLSEIAAVQRKVVNLFCGDHGAQIRRRYVKLFCFRGNGDDL